MRTCIRQRLPSLRYKFSEEIQQFVMSKSAIVHEVKTHCFFITCRSSLVPGIRDSFSSTVRDSSCGSSFSKDRLFRIAKFTYPPCRWIGIQAIRHFTLSITEGVPTDYTKSDSDLTHTVLHGWPMSKLGLGESIDIITFTKLFYYHDTSATFANVPTWFCACAKG